MAAGCGGNCAKIVLIIFNVIFLLTGLALLGTGIWLLVDPSSLITKFDQLAALVSVDRYLSYAAYVMIAAGAFVTVVSIFGCCGALYESVCLLSVYIFLLVLVMAIEIAAGVLALIFKQKIVSTLETVATCNMNNRTGSECEKRDVPSNFVTAMRFVQFELMCCGVKNYTDYDSTHIIHDKTSSNQLSWSCCKRKAGQGDFTKLNEKFERNENGDGDTTVFEDFEGCVNKRTPGTFYNHGCSQSVQNWIEKYAPIIIGVGIGMGAFELFVIIFAVCLCRNTSDKDD